METTTVVIVDVVLIGDKKIKNMWYLIGSIVMILLFTFGRIRSNLNKFRKNLKPGQACIVDQNKKFHLAYVEEISGNIVYVHFKNSTNENLNNRIYITDIYPPSKHDI